MTALTSVRYEPRPGGRPDADDASAYGLAGAVAGWMFVAAAALAVFLSATPGLGLPSSSTSMQKDVLFADSSLTATLGVLILAFGRRTPARALYAVPLVGSVLICIPMAVARTAVSTGQILLVWPLLFAGYLLPEAVARLSLAAAAAAFTVVAVRAGGERALASWIAVVTSLSLTLFLTVSMRRRINTLLAALGEQALTDALTGLANRRSFIGHLDRQIAAHQRDGRPFAVWFIDIDHFKRVNDTHGHPAGDRALAKLAGFPARPCAPQRRRRPDRRRGVRRRAAGHDSVAGRRAGPAVAGRRRTGRSRVAGSAHHQHRRRRRAGRRRRRGQPAFRG